MGNVFYFPWEVKFLEWLQSFECGFLNAIASGITMLGEEYLMVLIIGFCYWCVNKDLGRKLSTALISTLIANSLIQEVLLRRRPYMDNPTVTCIRAAHPEEDIMSVSGQGYSFPSFHATYSTAIYGTLAVNAKKKILTVLSIVLPLLIGISRLYFGVHYPTDVLAGWALGAAVIFVIGAAEKKWGYKVIFAGNLVIGVLGFLYCRNNTFFSAYGITMGLFAGFVLEEKMVRFEKPSSWIAWVMRPILGVVIFVILTAILKFPVKNLSADDHAAFLYIYRIFRYAVATFVIMGVYPMLFRKTRFLK